jgi:putative transposase
MVWMLLAMLGQSERFHAETIRLAGPCCFAVVEHADRRMHVLSFTANPAADWVAQ